MTFKESVSSEVIEYIDPDSYMDAIIKLGGDMAMGIENRETERLAREVAQETGGSLTLAIQSALKERLQRLKQNPPAQIMTTELDDILHRVDGLPTLDTRPEAEILGYDDQRVSR